MKIYLNQFKTIVKPFYLQYRRLLQNTKWYIQYYKAKKEKLYSNQLTLLDLDTSKKIVILVPHADDEWIGPYSVLKQRPPLLHCIYFNLFGNDYSENNIRIRNGEILASSKYWGYNLIDNYNYDVESLYNEIVTAKYCFIPSPIDWHREHRQVFQTFVQAYNKLSNEQKDSLEVYYYSVSVPHSYSENLYYIPLTKQEVEAKWNQFQKVYQSQAFMPASRYKLQLRIAPSNVGYAAQTFIRVSKERLNRDNNVLAGSEMLCMLSNLKQYINNIYTSRTIAKINFPNE